MFRGMGDQHVLDLSLRRSVSGWQKLKHSSGPRTVSVHAQLAGGCGNKFERKFAAGKSAKVQV